MNKSKCKHYDEELECCKLLSDWGQSMPVLQPCVESPCGDYSPITNYDRIKNMNVDELAEFLCGVYDLEDVVRGKFICGTVIPRYDADSIKKWLEMEER